MKTKTAITIIGCGVGSHSITPALSRLAAESDTLLGGARLLELFPDFTGERITLGADLEGTIKRVAENLDSHGRMIVLASGDSQVFGVAKTIARFVGDDYLTIFPNITAAQALMAELKLPSTENARLFSVHGSRVPALPWRSILSSELSIVYCDSETPASRVAELLIERFPACSARRGVVGEFLGSEKQRVVSASLRELAALDCAGMSLLLLPPVESEAVLDPGLPLGIPDGDFEHENGLITHSEVRSVVLSKLRLGSGVMWDVGAGSGSVGIEAALLSPSTKVFAVEREPSRLAAIRRNAEVFGAANIAVEDGAAAAVIDDLPSPRSIFVGGGGKSVGALVEKCFEKLLPGGTLVAAAVTLETKAELTGVLKESCREIVSVSVARARPLGPYRCLKPDNAIELFVYGKPI